MSVTPAGDGPPSLGEVVTSVTANVSSLVRLEIELVQAELMASARQAGTGLGLVAGAGALAAVAGLFISVAAALGLANLLPVWAAFLIVAAVYLIIGAVLVLVARGHFKKVTPPVKAQQEAVDTKEALASAVAAGRSRAQIAADPPVFPTGDVPAAPVATAPAPPVAEPWVATAPSAPAPAPASAPSAAPRATTPPAPAAEGPARAAAADDPPVGGPEEGTGGVAGTS